MMVGASPVPIQTSPSLSQGSFTLPHVPSKNVPPIDPKNFKHLNNGGRESGGGVGKGGGAGKIGGGSGVGTGSGGGGSSGCLKSPGTSEAEGVIRVGAEYQAEIPSHCSNEVDRTTDHKATLLWLPHSNLSDKKVEEYILISKERFGYSSEQALGLLLWHRYDYETALSDLGNFEPLQEEWTTEEKVLFEQAFNLHGKTFGKMSVMLPEKRISALVKYYYSWKKLRFKTSLLDKQAKKTQEDSKKTNGVDPDVAADEAPVDDSFENGTRGSAGSRLKNPSGRSSSSFSTSATTTSSGVTTNGDLSSTDEDDDSVRLCSNCHARCYAGDEGESPAKRADPDVADVADVAPDVASATDADASPIASSAKANVSPAPMAKTSPALSLGAKCSPAAAKYSPAAAKYSPAAANTSANSAISALTVAAELCYACLQHLRRNGELRVVAENEFRRNPYSQNQWSRHHSHGQTSLPRGMEVSEEDVRLFTAAQSPAMVEGVFNQLDKDIQDLTRQIQRNKQEATDVKTRMESRTELNFEDPVNNSKSSSCKSNRWTNEELLLAVQGVRQYGLDFKAIAEVIGNKTDNHVRSFYNNYKRRFNLESVLEEFEQAKAEKAVDCGKVEVPLFASTSSPMQRSVKRIKLLDNQEPLFQENRANSSSSCSSFLTNQTSSASNIKPQVIKVEASTNPISISSSQFAGGIATSVSPSQSSSSYSSSSSSSSSSSYPPPLSSLSSLTSHHFTAATYPPLPFLPTAHLSSQLNVSTTSSSSSSSRAQSLSIPAGHHPSSLSSTFSTSTSSSSYPIASISSNHPSVNYILSTPPSTGPALGAAAPIPRPPLTLVPSLPAHPPAAHPPGNHQILDHLPPRPSLPPPLSKIHFASAAQTSLQPHPSTYLPSSLPSVVQPPNAPSLSHPPLHSALAHAKSQSSSSSSSSRSTQILNDHNLNRVDRDRRGSQVGSPGIQIISQTPPLSHPAQLGHPSYSSSHPSPGHSPAGHPPPGHSPVGHPPSGHLPLGYPPTGHLSLGHPSSGLPPLSSTAKTALPSMSSTSRSSSSSNATGPSHYPPIPNHGVGSLPSHPAIPAHPVPNHIGYPGFGISPNLGGVPTSSIHYPLVSTPSTHPSAPPPLPLGYLSSPHALAAASIHSAAATSSSTASLTRPHLSGGVAPLFAPGAALPLNSASFLNRPRISSPQNNLVRPGAPLHQSNNSPIPGQNRNSRSDS